MFGNCFEQMPFFRGDGMNSAALSKHLAVHKPRLSARCRTLRAVISIFDPRAYFHLFRILNHYNQTHVIPRRQLRCGVGCAISPNASFAHGARIELGDGAHIGARCMLWAGPGWGRIVAGDNLLLGPGVMMTAASYRFRDGSPVTRQAMNEADIVIGDDVWIGANAIVLPGARIGDGVIVAAGAVVRGDVPAQSVFAGNPARKIGDR